MESLKHILAEHPFTQGLEKRYLSLLNGCASNVRFEPGERIFREGEEANKFYLVREGKLAIELFGAERAPTA
jgi:CRP/FNR family transcriptional regulator, cyclic AMP receptor protein